MTGQWQEGSGEPMPDIPASDVRPLADPRTRETAEQIKASLGIGVPRQRYRPGGLAERPDVSGLAEGLGLK
jgi:hypothetical protein